MGRVIGIYSLPSLTTYIKKKMASCKLDRHKDSVTYSNLGGKDTNSSKTSEEAINLMYDLTKTADLHHTNHNVLPPSRERCHGIVFAKTSSTNS
jgi:hypothetical protein